MGEVVHFQHRQRVHVRPQTNAARAGAALQYANHAGSGQPPMHFETTGRQFARDQIGGAIFFKGQFGMGVNIATNGHDFGKEGNGVKTHKGALKCRIDSVVQPGLPVYARFRYADAHADRDHQRIVRFRQIDCPQHA